MTDTEKPCCLDSFDHAKAECPQCRDLSCNHLGDVERTKQLILARLGVTQEQVDQYEADAKAEGRITAAEGLRIIGAERVKDKAALLETLKTLLPGVEIELTDIKLTAE